MVLVAHGSRGKSDREVKHGGCRRSPARTRRLSVPLFPVRSITDCYVAN